MISKTFGAPLGGTMRGGHHGVESVALCLITPPNFGGGGGICFPSMVVVALGEPGTPVTCCARVTFAVASRMQVAYMIKHLLVMMAAPLHDCSVFSFLALANRGFTQC